MATRSKDIKRPLAPFSKQLRVPKNNRTVYIVSGANPWERARMRGNRCLVLPHNMDPWDLEWPVSGCGVILLDYEPLDEDTAQLLGHALKRDGADEAYWCNHVANMTTYLFGQR